MAGNSGPMHDEKTWDEMSQIVGVDLVPERTTVTQKIRRIGGWDPELARAAMVANGAPATNVKVALTFLDYINPNDLGAVSVRQLSDEGRAFVQRVCHELNGASVDLIGTSPTTMIDRRFMRDGDGWDQEAMV